MIWTRSGRMHWTSMDAPGTMMDVRIVEGDVTLDIIDAESGEIIKTENHNHPLDAMASAEAHMSLAIAQAKLNEVLAPLRTPDMDALAKQAHERMQDLSHLDHEGYA